MRRILTVLALLVLVVTLAAPSSYAKDKFRMGIVVKIGGIPWFNAMEAGIKKAAEARGVDAWMIGPQSSDPALQVRAIEDLIAQGVDAIGVVPNDAKVLEPVLKRAKDKGILVITHESPYQKYADYDFELVTSQYFGETHMKLLAEKLGGKGGYVIYVGSLTVPLHNAWADAAIEYQQKNYPDMYEVSERFGVAESADDSKRTMNDLISGHPDLKGVIGFGSQGPIGAGRAIKERGMIGKIFVIGSFSPGQGKRLLKSGAVTGGYMWNPMVAGEVFVNLAVDIHDGYKPKSGETYEGLNEYQLDGNTLLGKNVTPINIDTVDELAAMGL